MQRYSKPSASSSRRYALEESQVEEYGYALPLLGRGIEKCPVPQFDMPATVDVRTFPLQSRFEKRPADRTDARPPLTCSRPRSSSSTPTTCRTRRAASKSTTERPPSPSSSRAASSSQSTRERPLAATSVRFTIWACAAGLLCRLGSGSRRVVLTDSIPRTHSLGNGQEGDRDQPVPARDHGRWCRYVLSSPSFPSCAPQKTAS